MLRVANVFFTCIFCVFFFKQKTAYEMRISDWSSDVCSSDLLLHGATPTGAERAAACWADKRGVPQVAFRPDWNRHKKAAPFKRNERLIDARSEERRVGKEGVITVSFGGRRIIKKKRIKQTTHLEEDQMYTQDTKNNNT